MNARIALVALTAVVLSTGCNSFHSDRYCDDYDESAEGQPAQYPHLAGTTLGNVVVHAAQLCGKNEAYIYLERAQGKRIVGRAASPGVPTTGCLELPANAQDLTQCPVIAPNAVLHGAFHQLEARGILANGVGISPCIDTDDGTFPEDPQSSVGVVHWRDAQEAVNVVAQLLETYDLKGGVGVAVRGIGCAYPE